MYEQTVPAFETMLTDREVILEKVAPRVAAPKFDVASLLQSPPVS